MYIHQCVAGVPFSVMMPRFIQSPLTIFANHTHWALRKHQNKCGLGATLHTPSRGVTSIWRYGTNGQEEKTFCSPQPCKPTAKRHIPTSIPSTLSGRSTFFPSHQKLARPKAKGIVYFHGAPATPHPPQHVTRNVHIMHFLPSIRWGATLYVCIYIYIYSDEWFALQCKCVCVASLGTISQNGPQIKLYIQQWFLFVIPINTHTHPHSDADIYIVICANRRAMTLVIIFIVNTTQ